MRSFFPFSFVFFLATAAVFVFQWVPFTGIFLMMVGAVFWSVLLVNAGMIGVAVEAASARVSRWWLVLPVAFYGGYWVVAVQDHMMLRSLATSYDAANARVAVPFDSNLQALVFSEMSASWFTQNYDLPVAYSANSNVPEGYSSYRMINTATCDKVRASSSLQASSVHAFGFGDGDAIGTRKTERRFCSLSMPERPELPVVRISRKEEKVFERTLPVTRLTTTITLPDNQKFELLGGHAAPLSWFPMPMMGCALDSGAAKWRCGAGFKRNGFTPINRDQRVLASALGLKPVLIADRKGGNPGLVLVD